MSINVIVIPENDFFEVRVKTIEEAYVNIKLGVPKVKERNAKYLAPFILNKEQRGVHRVYHILDSHTKEDCTVFNLGNSFILDERWDKMKQPARFEYHDLKSFGMVEIKDGILMKYDI